MTASHGPVDRGARHSQEARVAEHYDVNTRKFARRAQTGAGGTIHRAVWAPGLTTREEAYHFAERRALTCLEALPRRAPLDVVDLGCGTGATLTWLATRHAGFSGVGVTLSGDQVERATQRTARAGLGPRLRFVRASFLSVPLADQSCDLAIAVESFLHGPDAGAFFREVARLLRPGGRLLLVDDFLSPGTPASAAGLDDFVRGWRVGTLVSREDAVATAEQAGLVLSSSSHLTDWLELGRARDTLIAVLVALGARRILDRPAWGALVGGHALQRGLQRGLLQYWELQFTPR